MHLTKSGKSVANHTRVTPIDLATILSKSDNKNEEKKFFCESHLEVFRSELFIFSTLEAKINHRRPDEQNVEDDRKIKIFLLENYFFKEGGMLEVRDGSNFSKIKQSILSLKAEIRKKNLKNQCFALKVKATPSEALGHNAGFLLADPPRFMYRRKRKNNAKKAQNAPGTKTIGTTTCGAANRLADTESASCSGISEIA